MYQVNILGHSLTGTALRSTWWHNCKSYLLKVTWGEKQTTTTTDWLAPSWLTPSTEGTLVRPLLISFWSPSVALNTTKQLLCGFCCLHKSLFYSLSCEISAPVLFYDTRRKKSVMICLMIASHEKFYITTIKCLFVLTFYYSLGTHSHCIAQNSHAPCEGFLSVAPILSFNRIFFLKYFFFP